MRTQWNETRRLEEEVSNFGAPPHGEQVPPLEKNAYAYQAPTNPPPMMQAEKRDIIDQMDKAMTTRA